MGPYGMLIVRCVRAPGCAVTPEAWVPEHSGTVTAFFLGEHPLDRAWLNFFPQQDKAA